MDRFPPVIGIAGKARTGKDTAADFIVAERGGYRYSLADPIRAMIRAGFNINAADEYWRRHKEEPIAALGGVSLRQLMQTLGTDWGREMIGRDVWLVLATSRLIQQGSGMVIPDVRFDDEAEWIRGRGGVVLHLRRRNAQEVSEHISEAGVTVKPGEFVINNDGSMVDLQNSISDFLDQWR